MIRISNCEDRDAPANLDRTITITGNAESVALAQYLINMRSVQLLSTPTLNIPFPGIPSDKIQNSTEPAELKHKYLIFPDYGAFWK